MAVVKIARRNIEESTLSNPIMMISESQLDLWSAFHSDFLQVTAVIYVFYTGERYRLIQVPGNTGLLKEIWRVEGDS